MKVHYFSCKSYMMTIFSCRSKTRDFAARLAIERRTMGKSQKKRSMRRHNPMRVPDSHIPHGLASASSTSSKTQEILPIIQKVALEYLGSSNI